MKQEIVGFEDDAEVEHGGMETRQGEPVHCAWSLGVTTDWGQRMAKSRQKTWSPGVLTYQDGKRKGDIVRRHYLCWRLAQDPPLPERCDNEECRFYAEPLVWNNKPLKPILDHKNGVNTDNRPCNLQFLCPNCDSQNAETRGGANKSRVQKSPGGFAIRKPDGRRSFVLPAEILRYKLTGRDSELIGPSGPESEDLR